MAKVATFTDELTRKELGEHEHRSADDDHVVTAETFDDDVAKELHRLRVREAARPSVVMWRWTSTGCASIPKPGCYH